MIYGPTPTGFRKKTYDEILSDLRTRARLPEYFGPDADLSPYGPLGIQIELSAKEISSAWDGLEGNYNDAYLDTAIGVALDRVVKIAGVTRDGKVRYTTTLQITGEDFTPVTAGFKVGTKSGIKYRTISDAVIDAGVAVVSAEAEEYGYSSAVLADQLTQILTPVVGVYSVTNTTDAVGGNPTEPDPELKNRTIEKASLNTKDVGALTEIRIMIEADAEVRTCRIVENTYSVPWNGMEPNSMTFVIDGGSDEHVAGLIYKYKQGGVALNGTITQIVYDETGEAHTIKFSRPADIPVWISYEIQTGAGWIAANIREIEKRTVEVIGGTDTYVISGITYNDDYSGLKAGDDVLPLSLYAVLSGLPGIVNATILMGRSSGDVTHASLPMGLDEKARVYTANISVATI